MTVTGVPPSDRSDEERQRICDELDDLLDDVDTRLAREARESRPA